MLYEFGLIREKIIEKNNIYCIIKAEKKINNNIILKVYNKCLYNGRNNILNVKYSIIDNKIKIESLGGNINWNSNIFYGIYFQDKKDKRYIPKKIFLTYKNKRVPKVVLQKYIYLNPNYNISFSDDHDCYKFLNNYFCSDFAEYFKNIKWGPIKADFWRLCVLYVFGGVYYDIDINPHASVDTFIEKNTTFSTCLDYKNRAMFQAFIATTPENPILLECLMIMYLKKFIKRKNYSIMMGTKDMRAVLENNWIGQPFRGDYTYNVKGQKIKILQEYSPNGNLGDFKVRYKNRILFSSRYREYDSSRHQWR